MGSTMAAKILARASGASSVATGDAVVAAISFITCLDGQTFIDNFREKNLKVWDPERMIFCFDHMFQPDWMPVRAATEHPKIKSFAKEQGIPDENIYDLGRNGISHQIPVEHGWALPGTVCVGADTQSSTMGATNCFALPALFGVDPIIVSGKLWMIVPECVRITLTGAFPEGVNGKDFVYRLIADLGEDVQGRVIEFDGPGVANLSMDMRLAIANGSVQIGALTIIFPSDATLLDYIGPRAREEFEPVQADSDADYVAHYDYDLSRIEPLVAGPHNIELVRPLNQVTGLPVTAANIGSCSSGRLSDLALAASILRGRHVHPSVRLVVTPISAETYREANRAGIIQDLLDAGATVTQPGCGACYSGNLSPLKLGDGERCISTSVETLRGRMGSNESEVILANAAVVAASAIAGEIADPARYRAKEKVSA
ncbi:3-isopropylmalate dehydratase large subunit [Sphingobium subterraneum]|uniref:3-isopropylmalate/(R)-2-methylmalate dehydratase large subunit n=1 Tax=Sphingobium subterraneum TaxID=627688 RepID=A0A841J3H1_9SPHN|nr:aconitase family protein [Sphingobium subterraneum]MBB6125334.1 3-isopropylmalate/(R)-2-methylmalate dehydratase large subunit [Sphingobium subterraneum]